MLVLWVADPVNAGVAADGLVEGVDHDHLEPLVNRVLGYMYERDVEGKCVLWDGVEVDDTK